MKIAKSQLKNTQKEKNDRVHCSGIHCLMLDFPTK